MKCNVFVSEFQALSSTSNITFNNLNNCTYIADDPGKKWGIYRRGVKYPEKICNHSKSSTSVMFCGSADGTLLPPYVIYKSIHLYDTWKEHGPAGALKSAWRIVLTEWKVQNMRMSAVQKDTFPRLLKKCLDHIDKVKQKNPKENLESSAIRRILRSSFAATGIYPLDKHEVLKKLPDEENKENVNENVEGVLTDYLKEKRFGNDEHLTKSVTARNAD
ncbi:hypothetical protein NQ315_012741 [Exocentrus adspersus]|uniref:Uncharacterized protein n=1 Tax=Exocentrus adspersus TaxID=1586481 RepID=A0AAV8V6B8_9CUCU|nr:hypothetical protein NQ315_012741 [Exocentrus adspersus]